MDAVIFLLRHAQEKHDSNISSVLDLICTIVTESMIVKDNGCCDLYIKTCPGETRLESKCCIQWRSQDSEKITHIKGRLLSQAVSQFNYVPFHNGNFPEWKEFAPRGSEFFPLREVPYGMENHFYHIR